MLRRETLYRARHDQTADRRKGSLIWHWPVVERGELLGGPRVWRIIGRSVRKNVIAQDQFGVFQIVRHRSGLVARIEQHLDFRFARVGITTAILGGAGFVAVFQTVSRE